MKPHNLKSKIFLDSGDPKETKETIKLLGFLDGQTTNPTLIVKNPKAQLWQKQGKKFTEEEVWNFYKYTAKAIAKIIPAGSVSLEVYADNATSAGQMIEKARQINYWIPNAHIKLPITREGLKAAEQLIKEGFRINMTLCFSQEQVAAVYSATRGAKKGQVFISPFVGRIDDRGENGMDLISNIVRMYQGGDGHVEVLAASVRNINHFLCAIKLGSDIITAPFKILEEWHNTGMLIPDNNFLYPKGELKDISYQQIDIKKDWQKFNITHELTEAGINRFAGDWNALINKNKV